MEREQIEGRRGVRGERAKGADGEGQRKKGMRKDRKRRRSRKVGGEEDIYIHISGVVIGRYRPLSALTRCDNVRNSYRMIKKISPLIYSQSWVGSCGSVPDLPRKVSAAERLRPLPGVNPAQRVGYDCAPPPPSVVGPGWVTIAQTYF